MRSYPRDCVTDHTDYVSKADRLPPDRLGTWLSALLQSTLDSVIVIDQSYQTVLVNEQAGRLFGTPAQGLLSRSIAQLVPARLLEHHSQAFDQLATTRLGGRRLHIRVDSIGVRADRTEFPFEASISRVTIRGELFFAVVMRELPADSGHRAIAKNILTENRRRAVTSQQANEVEKRRLSRLLYDDIGQSLGVLKLDMDWIQASLPPDQEDTRQRVMQMQSTLDRTIARIKNIASTMRPPLLDDFGLAAALKWVAADFQKRTGIDCRFDNHGSTVRVGDPIESAFFRLAQEGLLNIERHANATKVTISFSREIRSVDVLIADNGIGIADDYTSKAGCYGMIAMQERIYTLGGSVSIRNLSPQGLAIHASIPVDAA